MPCVPEKVRLWHRMRLATRHYKQKGAEHPLRALINNVDYYQPHWL
jgi:hypothetical protein